MREPTRSSPTPLNKAACHRLGARATAFLLGLVVVFVILEATLRVTGLFYQARTSGIGAGSSICTSCTRVVCLGDSFTYGIGASAGNDYPSQLARILNHSTGLREGVAEAIRGTTGTSLFTPGDSNTGGGGQPPVFAVFNGGVPGANTATVLGTLGTHLETFRPRFVLVLVGTNNEMNYAGYRAYLDRDSLAARATGALHHLRVVRLADYLVTRFRERARSQDPNVPGARKEARGGRPWETYIRWHARSRPGEALSPEFLAGTARLALGRYDEARQEFERGLRRVPSDSSLGWGMGEVYRGMLRTDIAREWYERAIASDPSNPVPCYSLGRLTLDQGENPDEALEWFRRGVEADPTFGSNHAGQGLVAWIHRHDPEHALELLETCVRVDPDNPDCYPELVALSQHLGRSGETVEFLDAFAPGSPVAADYRQMLAAQSRETGVAAWIRSDLEELVGAVRRAGATPVLLTYPDAQPVNAIVAGVARRTGCRLVDTEKAFEAAQRDGTPRAALFVPDGHCNDRGYGIIARLVARSLVAPGPAEQPAAP